MKRIDIIFQRKKILVMGLGMTGLNTSRTLAGLGNHIIAFDNNTSLDPEKMGLCAGAVSGGSIEVVLKPDEDVESRILEGVDLVIASPGIPCGNRLLSLADETGIPVWDELELSFRLLNPGQRSRLAAVTGTNGKTTVVKLIGAILDSAGLENRVCGNVGSPVLDTIKIDGISGCAFDDDIIRVVEVSSFQLERSQTFKPFAGVLLNITSDHMDRHGDISEYARLKMKLFARQDSQDFAIINMDDSRAFSLIPCISGRKQGPRLIRYSLDPGCDPEVWYEGCHIHYRIPPMEGKIDIEGAMLKGRHNMSNSAASAAAALIMGADPDSAGAAIRDFKPLSHRMEYLGLVSGIRCINDSKSTNPGSVIAALRDFDRVVTIIMGGLDKEMDFRAVIPSLRTSVKNIILIGSSAEKMQRLFSRETGIGIYVCSTMEEAVEKGLDVTSWGDVLLLSPGCASMDMFTDYRDRGNRFKKAVFARQKI
jgi:UDP-N-acetylmuramoylalanine--D-glutamate ligase